MSWTLLFSRLIDLLLPPLCLLCDEPVPDRATLCPDCWKKVQFISHPFCARCGTPFDFPVEDGTLCGSCLADPPPFAKARAAMVYDDASKRLVLNFKHGDRLHSAKALANWMSLAGADLLGGADALVPVPLHRRRLFARRYNQSAILAQQIGLASGKPVLVDALLRIRNTPQQKELKRKERKDNVHGAFAVPPEKKNDIGGKTLVLIDDVLTTGATAQECARTLLAEGAEAVHVLTLSRVKSFV
ncbi:MAG: ComF family protein [Alphaproteobacteria bacterium]|nr:ComF family protein [Alphaproteobacteria bacterium]